MKLKQGRDMLRALKHHLRTFVGHRQFFVGNPRTHMLQMLPKNAIGAELGVFKGEFSRVLLQHLQPRELHLIDPWWKEAGEYYPDWGAYTDYGALRTHDAYNAAVNNVSPFQKTTDIKIIVDYAVEYLETIPDGYFDWIYIDTTHSYNDTRRELEVSMRKVKDHGFIAGDDWDLNPEHEHHGVFIAVQETVRSTPYGVIYADLHRQWCIRKLL